MKINAKSFFNYFIIHPFSKKLSPTDKVVASAASTVLFFLTFGTLHLYASLKGKKITHDQSVQKNKNFPKPQDPKTPSSKKPIVPSQNTARFSALRVEFENTIDKMGQHIWPYQRQTLLALFDQAVQLPQPGSTLYYLIESKINQPDGWGKEKAILLQQNLLPIVGKLSVKAPATPVVPSQNPSSSGLLRVEFENAINKIGQHILPYQRQTLLALFDQAVQSQDPREFLKNGIEARINQTDGWGSDKALHLKQNLLPILGKLNQPILSVSRIAQQPIDAQGNKLVCFYKTGITEFLGNFAICPGGLNVFGQNFKCAEAAFQWRKYQLAGIQDSKMNEFFQADGEQSYQLSSKYFAVRYKNQLPPQWESGVRDDVMWEVLQHKFAQNPTFKHWLNDTKGAYLLEHKQMLGNYQFEYWSDNNNGSGKNMLGKMLMAIREGQPKPPVDDASDADMVKYYAQYANQSLTYPIF